MKYTVITENDLSQLKDNTGNEYHLPKGYLNNLTNGQFQREIEPINLP